jgi:hypothetical protein
VCRCFLIPPVLISSGWVVLCREALGFKFLYYMSHHTRAVWIMRANVWGSDYACVLSLQTNDLLLCLCSVLLSLTCM